MPPSSLPNVQGINWREQQPGYLAGIVAASVSETGHIAAVGGTAVIPAVVNYIEGYANGAKSVNPDVVVTVTYVSGAPDTAAFNDPAGGQAIAQQLLAQDPEIDVMFQVAGKTGNGVLQAACDAGHLRHRRRRRPVRLHARDGSLHDRQRREEADQERQRRHPAHRRRHGRRAASCASTLDTEDVGLSPFHDFESLISPEIQRRPGDGRGRPGRRLARRPANRRKAAASACRRCPRRLLGAIRARAASNGPAHAGRPVRRTRARERMRMRLT